MNKTKIEIQKKCQRFCNCKAISVPENIINATNVIILNHYVKHFAFCSNITAFVRKAALVCRNKRENTSLMALLSNNNTLFKTYSNNIDVIKEELYKKGYTQVKLNEKDYTYLYHRIHPSAIPNLNSSGVYIILNKQQKKVYIGSTKQPFISRWKSHILTPHLPNNFISDNNSIFYTVFTGIYDEKELLSLESKLIKHYLKLNKYKVINTKLNF